MSGHMQHIRDRYGVPAYRGHRIRYSGGTGGTGFEGTIISARSDYLRVRSDSGKRHILHPTWRIEYLGGAA